MKLANGQGTTRLVQMLGSIRKYDNSPYDPDTCAACGDGECSGACSGAVAIVRQVMEALDDQSTAAWWLEEFGFIDGAWRGAS